MLAALVTAVATAEEPSLTPHDCQPHVDSRARSGARSTSARPVVPNRVSVLVDPYPIRIWYDPTHAHSVEILDEVAETLRTSWQVQVDELGFRPPALPDGYEGPEFDVYLVEYYPFTAYVSGDLPYLDLSDPDDGYNASAAFMVIDRRLPLRWVPSYLAHEFNHVLQYATDYSEPTLPLWEGTATAAQEWTVGPAGRWELDVPSLQEATRFPTLVGDSYAIWYEWDVGYTFEYGTAFFVRFLDEKHGAGDGRTGARLWENAAQEGPVNEPDAVDAFAETGEGTLGEVLNEFALVRFLTGADWDPRGLSDAGGWDPEYAVPADPLTAEGLLGDHAPTIGAPMITGQVFWDLSSDELAAIGETELSFEAPSAAGLRTGLMVATWSVDGGVGSEATEGFGDRGDRPVITLSTAGLSRVVVAITNLGPDGWDGDQPPYVDGDQVLRVAGAGAPAVAGGRLVGGAACSQGPGLGAWTALVTAALAARRRTAGRSRARGL